MQSIGEEVVLNRIIRKPIKKNMKGGYNNREECRHQAKTKINLKKKQL